MRGIPIIIKFSGGVNYLVEFVKVRAFICIGNRLFSLLAVVSCRFCLDAIFALLNCRLNTTEKQLLWLSYRVLFKCSKYVTRKFLSKNCDLLFEISMKIVNLKSFNECLMMIRWEIGTYSEFTIVKRACWSCTFARCFIN